MHSSPIPRGVARLSTALVAALVFALPGALSAFTTFGGGTLSQSSGSFQRDVRVFENFADATANDNLVPDDDNPGALGAQQAIWKAAAAWGSHLPSAGRNFDYDWQGSATSVGGTNDNTVSSLGGSCSGGTLAFAEGPITNGWRIRFCENRTWDDGPGLPTGFDLQGVGVHELGHALGLGHSQPGNCGGNCLSRPVMCSTVCTDGSEERGLKPDDRDGLEFLYGTIPVNKPEIIGISGTFQTGSTLTLDGLDFASTVNVKFTARTTQNSGTIPGVVYNMPSTNGGTRVQVTIPASAMSGNVFVWQPSSGGLSNGHPIYIDEDPPVIFTVVPGTGPVRGGTVITISGDHFFPNARVEVGGLTATPLSRTETEITAVVPAGSVAGQSASVRVTQGTGDHEVPAAWLYGENPVEFTWNGTPSPGASIVITVYGPSNRDVAVAAGTPGETQALGMTFCAESPFPFVRRLNANLNTGPAGRVDVVWAGLPGEIFDQWNLIGVIKLGPGTFQNLGCVPLTVLP